MCTHAAHVKYEGEDGMRRPFMRAIAEAMGRAGANSAIDVGWNGCRDYKSEDHAAQSSSGVLSRQAITRRR